MAKSGAFEAVILMILVLLCAVFIVIVIQGPDYASDRGNWSVFGSGTVSKIYMAEDGTLYLFGGENGNTIYAIGPDGDKKWAFEVTGPWLVSKQAFAVDDGTIYLLLYEFDGTMAERYGSLANYRAADDQGYFSDGNRSIMAISDLGKMLWHKDVPNRISYYGTSIYADSGRVYYYNNDSVLVLDRNGRSLFTVTGIYGPPTVDEHGDIFVARLFVDENGGFGPGRIIEAYHPDGTLYWRNDIGRTIYGMIRTMYGMSTFGEIPPFNSILRYQDDSLYAWVENGTIRLRTNGSIIWSKTFPWNGGLPLSAMPMDSRGNMYYLFNANPPYIDVVTPDGKEILRDYAPHNATFPGKTDGVVYFVDYYFNNTTIDHVEKSDLMFATITAYDILDDRYLWNYTFAPEAAEIVIAVDDVEVTLPQFQYYHSYIGQDGRLISVRRYLDANADEQAMLMPDGLYLNWGLRVEPGTDALYLNYYTYNCQQPVVNNQTTCLYANSLYAIADNGTLLWEKPLSSLVTSMAVNNSTLYYSTRNGGFYVENAVKIGGGLALLAMLYLTARFLLVGSVARARSRLDKNENRNSVMKYIVENPGLTARDIARGLDANLGTIRYHLLILGMNHKIITYKADGKYIRYFTNSKSYSEAQQQAVSLVRREGMGKVLDLLITNPGVTSRELSLALGAQESAVSRNLRELLQRGIVDKNVKQDGSPAYSVSAGQKENIAFAIGRVKN
jgi:predicted transcriptional regulator